MRNLKPFFTVIILLSSFCINAQSSDVVQEYIHTYKNMAISEMQRTGVPAAIKLAQGIIETEAGQSLLVNKSNNHFGIKCKSTWTGESVSHDDDAQGECFRKYDDAFQSYKDHSNFLKSNQRYAFLFDLDPADFEGWANGLKKAGYATNPKYPAMLIKVINENNLQDYSLIAMGKKEDENKFSVASVQTNENNIAKSNVRFSENKNLKEEVISQKKYPSNQFIINETKVVYVQRGKSFLTLALEYELPLNRLFEYNDMKEAEVAEDNQLIFLQRKSKTGSIDFHIVERGESLHHISQKEGIRLQNLLEYNSLTENQQPSTGEKLYLKIKAPNSPELTTQPEVKTGSKKIESIIPSTGDNEKYAQTSEKENNMVQASGIIVHTVQLKENLYQVSKMYNVGVMEIYEWNKLSSYDLKEGQQLKINKK